MLILKTSNWVFELNTDAFDCVNDPCHLAWLVRDNRNLLSTVQQGKCSNGSSFDQLDVNEFQNCPVSDEDQYLIIIYYKFIIIMLSYKIVAILYQIIIAFLFLFDMHIQRFICPLDFDGQYADPDQCSMYYLCVSGEAYIQVHKSAIVTYIILCTVNNCRKNNLKKNK
jgi:hypothetical protein